MKELLDVGLENIGGILKGIVPKGLLAGLGKADERVDQGLVVVLILEVFIYL